MSNYLRERGLNLELARRNLRMIEILEAQSISNKVPSGKWAWRSMKDDPPPDSIEFIYVCHKSLNHIDIYKNPPPSTLFQSSNSMWSPVFIPESYKKRKEKENKMSESQKEQEIIQNFCEELRKIFGDLIPKPQPEEDDSDDEEDTAYRVTLDYMYPRLIQARALLKELNTNDLAFKYSIQEILGECINRVSEDIEKLDQDDEE